MSKPKHILVAIDGTGSRIWHEKQGGASYTCEFWREFGRNTGNSTYRKAYWHGPDDVISGSDASVTIPQAIRFIRRSAAELFPAQSPTRQQLLNYLGRKGLANTPTNLASARRQVAFTNRIAADKDRRNIAKLRITLVGHSRGGAMAIDIAKRLRNDGFKVYFMGLYDAVDRSPDIVAHTISNTQYVQRSIRLLSNSRSSFNIAGKRHPTADTVSTVGYATSHGGMGGDVDANPGFLDDYSCTPNLNADEHRYLSELMPMDMVKRPDYYQRYSAERERLKREAEMRYYNCVCESDRVRSEMIAAARQRGLPI